MNIATILESQASERGGFAAIIAPSGARTSFRELWDATGRCAALLQRTGLKRGDGVLLFHPVAPELYVFLIALFRIGAVGLVLDPSAGRDHIETCCDLWKPKGFFGSPKAHLLRLIQPTLRRIPLQYASGWFPGAINASDLPNGQGPSPLALEDADPAIATFTSGSTGRPKAAVRSHGFLVAQYEVLQECLQLAPGQIDLTTLPIFVLANLAAGVTSVLPDADMRHPSAANGARILRQMQREAVQSTAASPAFIERLIAERKQPPPTYLQKVFIGGAPVFPSLLGRARMALPTVDVVAVYGSTEAEPMAEIHASEITREDMRAMATGAGLLTGVPVPQIQLRVVRNHWGSPLGPLAAPEFASVEMPKGEPGEIVVSGAHVLPGYLHGDGDAETKFVVDGTRWHRTGDLGYFDARGRLWLLGRCAARIEDERGTVFPFSVECAAMQNTGVERAALLAQEQQRCLIVQPKRGTTVDTATLQRDLSWAKLDRILLVNGIPLDRRHNAKIDYPALRKMLAP